MYLRKKATMVKPQYVFEKMNFFAWSLFQKFWPQITEHLLYKTPFHDSLSKKNYVLVLEYLFSFASVADFL